MQDWKLTDKRIYNLLKHPHQIDKAIVEEITSAYLEFAEELLDYLNKENDNNVCIRKLNMACIDFGTLKALEESSATENSSLKIVLLDKLLSLINLEQELLYRQMEYPKFFTNIESEWKSPFYLNDEEIKLINIMEVVCRIFYLIRGLLRYDYKEIYLSDFSRLFEKIFTITFSDVYKKEKAVKKRKSQKITEFLDRLKTTIIQKSIQ